MGFLDELRLHNVFNPSALNQNEPLFGGLIPRREIMQEQRPVMPDMPQQVNRSVAPVNGPIMGMASPFHNLGLDKPVGQINNNTMRFAGPDYDAEKIQLARRKQESDEMSNSRELGLKEQEAGDKSDIEHRKLALETWKAHNPEGEIKADENGKLHVINKQTGNSIDTGLTAEHFSEKEKLDLQHKYNLNLEDVKATNAKNLENIREGNREKLKGTPSADKTPSYVSPSQQRVSEDDAANELLQDPRYSWAADKYITFDKDKGVQFKEPTLSSWPGSATKDQIDNAKKVIEQFKTEWKTKAKERMNVSRDNNTGSTSKITIIAPDGVEGTWDANKPIPDGFKRK